MNYQVQSKEYPREELLSLMYKAAEKPDLWNNALHAIALSCGAKAAIITLRSQKNCEVVISNEMEKEFHSPFVDTIPPRLVEDYVINFKKLDAWSNVQITNRAFVPTLMSKKLPIAQLSKTTFWPWLHKLGVNDTIVAEIGHSKHYWTAFNLFFDNQDEQDAIDKLRFIESLFEDIKRAWSFTREAQRSINLQQQLIFEISAHPEAIFLINEYNQVVAKSDKCNVLISQKICDICSKSNALLVNDNLIGIDEQILLYVKTFSAKKKCNSNYAILIPNHEILSLSTGENLGYQLIKIKPIEFDENLLPWEHPLLNLREQTFLKTIAKTNKKLSGADAINIGERHSRNIWNAIEKKIGKKLCKSDLVLAYKNRNNPKQEESGSSSS